MDKLYIIMVTMVKVIRQRKILHSHSVLISCLDSHEIHITMPKMTKQSKVPYEISLNYLFEVAKDEQTKNCHIIHQSI